MGDDLNLTWWMMRMGMGLVSEKKVKVKVKSESGGSKRDHIPSYESHPLT